jgi:hypothetical protein
LIKDKSLTDDQVLEFMKGMEITPKGGFMNGTAENQGRDGVGYFLLNNQTNPRPGLYNKFVGS